MPHLEITYIERERLYATTVIDRNHHETLFHHFTFGGILGEIFCSIYNLHSLYYGYNNAHRESDKIP